ncbi:hypothetical protein AAEU32_11950 [Pseudoalteromonas sp. SSDWG2]|uniref:hypothetical protein n=1 Tax=Pseudoalteromonas sp. SSDWG2 TaxID=3139391 RepID=UPI003BABDF9E
MDIMIPFLGQITRLEVQHKGAFHVAGVKDSKVQKVRNDLRRAKDQRGMETLVEDKDEVADKKSTRLDTWA